MLAASAFNVDSMIETALAARGVHGFARRFGGSRLRQRAFDAKYRTGAWVYDERDEAVTATVERFAAGGRILMLGCGTGSILKHLRADSYGTIIGIDLSPTAIRIAEGMGINGAQFHVGDMEAALPEGPHDVIWFPRSLTYVPRRNLGVYLARLHSMLSIDGAIVATVKPQERNTIAAIRANYEVLAGHSEPWRLMLAFR